MANPFVVNVSFGINSTDSENDHQLAAPAPNPFQSPLNATTTVCVNDSDGGLYVSSRQCNIQRGALDFDSGKVDALKISAGASKSWYEVQTAMPHGGPTPSTVSYLRN